MKRNDLVIAPVCEAALIFIAAIAAWLTQTPLIFASLGPTAFEMVETPKRPSARPYNVIVGHLIAVLSAFLALFVTHAWSTPGVSSGSISMLRVWAATIAALLTVFGTLLAKATQPAALSTTLVIALGPMQRPKDGLLIMAAILLMSAFGEPLRRWRAQAETDTQKAADAAGTK